MADLHDDRRKEEEEYGGFEPDRDDDESFMLEDENDYPAKLPDNFSDVPSLTERVTASIENSDSEKINEEINEDKNQEEYSEPSPIEPQRVEPEEIKEEEVIETYSEPESEEIQEIESESIPEDETIEFDEDFKKKIQEDIDKSKAKREANEIAEDEDSFEPARPRVYSDEPETMVVITDIEADSPSKLRADNSVVPEVPQPPMTGNIPENMEGENQPIEPEKKKKKKKAPIWILMLYSSVATFIVTLGIAALIWYLLQDNHDSKNDGKVKSERLAVKNTKKNTKKANTSASKQSEDEMNWLDSMELNKKDTALKYKEDKEFFSGLEDELDEEDKIDKKPPVKKQEKEIAPKKEEPKVKEPKKELPKKKKEDLATNNSENIVPKEKKKSNVKVDESQFSMPQPNGPVPEKGTFTVQIYSSPSLEDAESWLGQLKAKQLPNAMITEQQVKGRTWYRVRYGKFETKEAARSSALELGYSQSWIDRVK